MPCRSAYPEIQIGTVDKFQGQEAAIIILSMATSSPEDAPRGMEFLYSLNRLNVAVSQSQGCIYFGSEPRFVRARMPVAAPDAIGKCIMPFERAGTAGGMIKMPLPISCQIDAGLSLSNSISLQYQY